MRSTYAIVALGALLAPLTGCRMIAQQAFSEAKGAEATIVPVTDPSAAVLAKFNSVQFEPCTTDTSNRITPASLLSAYDRAATEMQTKDLAKIMPGGSPTLTVRTALWYFQSKGAFSGAEIIGRARMYDGGTMVGDVVVRGESESYFAGGENAMTASMVRAIAKYLGGKRGNRSE